MDDLIRQIKEKEDQLWYLYLALQKLQVTDSDVFRKQDFSRLREQCRQILSLVGETELSKL